MSIAPLISQKEYPSVGISTVPCANTCAPFHNGFKVGCWASKGQIPQPARDKSKYNFQFLLI